MQPDQREPAVGRDELRDALLARLRDRLRVIRRSGRRAGDRNEPHGAGETENALQVSLSFFTSSIFEATICFSPFSSFTTPTTRIAFADSQSSSWNFFETSLSAIR